MPVKRSVGLWGLLFLSIGGIIGSGWLFGPFFAAQVTGPAAIFAWVLGGFLMIIVALTFAELSAMFPVTGASIQFLQISHGTLVSFTFAWIGWVSSIAVAPIETLALLQYATHYFPWLTFKQEGVVLLTGQGMLIAALVMALICWINVVGVNFLSKSNIVLGCFKLLVPIMTVIFLIVYGFHAENFTSHGFLSGGWQSFLASLPTAGIIFSFMGYNSAIQMAGEARRPQFAIPFAILGSLLLCMVLYCALQFAFIGAVPAAGLIDGWSHLSFDGDAGPFVGLMMFVGIIWWAHVLYIDAVASPFGTALIYTGSSARMAYAMGKNGYMPSILRHLNKHRTPARLVWVNFFLGIILFLPFPTWQTMMSFLVSAIVFAYAVGPLALVVLRKTAPDHVRPFRLPQAKAVSFLAFYICNLILLWVGWTIMYKMLIVIALGYILLWAYRKYGRGERFSMEWHNAGWLFAYLILLGFVSYAATFSGGRGWLPFGWDFFAVLIQSIIVFIWAYKSGCKTPAQLQIIHSHDSESVS